MTDRELALRKRYNELKAVRDFLKKKYKESAKIDDPSNREDEMYRLAGYCVEREMFRIYKQLV